MVMAQESGWKHDGKERRCEDSFFQEIDFLTRLNNTVQRKSEVFVIKHEPSYNSIGGSGIAFTDLKNVHLNFGEIKILSGMDYSLFLSLVKGFNYHELSHVMFTKHKSNLYDNVRFLVREALNILEDQRIENLFGGLFSKSREYFRLIALNYLLKNPASMDAGYYLLYGRRFWLDSKLIKSLRARFVSKFNEGDTVLIEKIIDDYLKTVNADEQIRLASELADILEKLFGRDKPKNICGDDMQGKGQSRKAVGEQEKDLTKEVQEEIKEEEKAEKSDDCGDDSVSGGLESDDDLKDLLEEELCKSKNVISDDVERQKSVMNKYDFDNSSSVVSCRFYPSASHVKMAKNLTRFIKRLKTDLGNKTAYNQRKGRIHLRKAMINHSCPNDFKRFKHSLLDKTRMGVCVLLDSSGSMSSRDFDVAIGCGWSIARSFENTGSFSKVYEFSEDFGVMKDFGECVGKASWGRNFASLTNVDGALCDAKESLLGLRKKESLQNLVVIVISDGQFGNTAEVKKVIGELRKEGVYVALIKVSNYGWSQNLGFNQELKLESFDMLTRTMSDMVKGLQSRIIKKVELGVL